MTAPDDTNTQATQRPIAPDPAAPDATPESAASPAPAGETVHDRVVQMLQTIFDPEIPINIYEMGLIYDLDVNTDGDVVISMTLTSPTCRPRACPSWPASTSPTTVRVGHRDCALAGGAGS